MMMKGCGIVCGNCNMGVDTTVGWNMFCTSCSRDIEVVPRKKLNCALLLSVFVPSLLYISLILFLLLCCFRYGFYLNDDTTTLEATLYSPDAEKLSHFTTRQVFEAQEKGSPLNNDIEALRSKVFCFSKYFESDFHGEIVKKYPILKVYTVEEIVAGKAALDDVMVGASSSVQLADVEAAPSLGDGQLFSPTIKNVLDEIDEALARGKTSDAQGSIVKRALALGEGSAEPVPTVSSFQPKLTAAVIDDAALLGESPTKKVKNREKEKRN